MKDIDEIIKSLVDIESAYKYVEDNINELEANHYVTEFWVKYRNKITDINEKQMAQWELEFFLFQIIGAKVFSFSYATGENPGDVYEYPILDEHQTKAFEYLKVRAKSTNSVVLKARFNHLLWKAIKGIKNKTYAIVAIDAYFEILLTEISSQSVDTSESERLITKKIDSLSSIISEAKYKAAELIKIVRKILLNENNLKFYNKVHLIETMLKYPSVFKPVAFEDILSVFEDNSLISGSQKTDDFTMANSYLPVAVRVASKLKADIGIWHSKIGDAHIRLGDTETDPERNWIKQQQYALAIQSYRQAGNEEKRIAAELKYSAQRENVTLPTSVIDYSPEQITQLKEIEEAIKQDTEKLLELPTDSICEFLAKGKYLPSAELLKETGYDKENVWLEGITTIKFDSNKNIESIKSDSNENENGIMRYRYHLRHYVSPYLYYLFIPGIRSGKLTFLSFIKFLKTYTWIGFPLTKKDLSGKLINYNWISMVAPALQEYFLQMQSSLLSEDYKPNFMLAIDSLTIKFEGLLREFCTRINVPTSTSNKGSIQEMYIHQLLKHPTIIHCFSEDDRAFFEFLFAKENGFNLRNNVAHCYFDYTDYSYQYFHLLFAALLRLAKYSFKADDKV